MIDNFKINWLFLGTYGRTTAESEVDENKPSRVSKKVKKEKEEDYGD
jgi:hypothetical protein